MKIMMGVLSSSWWCEELSRFFISWFRKGRDAISFLSLLPQMKEKKSNSTSVYSKEKEEDVSVSLLDLPDLTFECIFERLPPSGLLSMSTVSTSLREKCTSDHLWEKHMNHKWGSLIIGSAAAYREWQCYIASRKKRELLGKFSKLSWNSRSSKINKSCSVMDWYLSLETGNFWFPAQVFNREVQNGHIGFMLSCYDAEVSYDSGTNTFKARYPAQGRRTIEENIGWNRLRAPGVDTPAHVLHVSDCLNDLKPDDHIEIQWRKSKEFPYGWWYGVVGHLESCNGNVLNCNCHTSETVILEFKQYNPGSKWRQMVINRNDHREVGNEVDGFYGGIRKLYNEEEISMWKGLWPSSTLE